MTEIAEADPFAPLQPNGKNVRTASPRGWTAITPIPAEATDSWDHLQRTKRGLNGPVHFGTAVSDVT